MPVFVSHPHELKTRGLTIHDATVLRAKKNISAISPFRDYGNWTRDRCLFNTSHSKPDMKDIWATYLKQDFDTYNGLRHLA